MNRLEEESNKEENEYLCQLDNFLVHNHFFILKSLKNTKRKKKNENTLQFVFTWSRFSLNYDYETNATGYTCLISVSSDCFVFNNL